MESNKDDGGNGCVWVFFILLALVIFVSFASTNSKTSDKKPDNTAACVSARTFVRRQLKAPSTAEFPLCNAATITHSGNTWTVRSYVDAQNSFGAMLRSQFVVKMEYRPSEKAWYPLDVQIVDP